MSIELPYTGASPNIYASIRAMPPPDEEKPLDIASRLIGAGRDGDPQIGAVNPPIYRASTILKPNLAAWRRTLAGEGYRYGLLGTPTSRAFERAMAELYGAEHCIAVSSGLAMITVAILALVKTGDHILVTDSAYEPTRRFCDGLLNRLGVATTYYDPLVGAGIAELIRKETVLVFTESPGSLTFEMQDIPAITAAAHAAGVRVVMDNTWATFIHFNPFRHGVDVVLEASSKYAAGHSDVILGAILANGELGRRLFATAKSLGIGFGPEDLYLAQRGLRSMALRLERSGATGIEVAAWLKDRPEVKRVLHPALPHDAGHALWRRDMTGAAGLFAIVLEPCSDAALLAFFDGFLLFGIGVSWGGYESLIITQEMRTMRTAVKWAEPGPLIRLYTGLEAPADLIGDLDAAFARLHAAS